MSNYVSFYRGIGNPTNMDSNGLYITNNGQLYSGYANARIGDNLGSSNLTCGRGFYWYLVPGTTNKIYLSQERPATGTTEWTEDVLCESDGSWEVGDELLIVNNNRYYTKITGYTTTSNRIVLTLSSSFPYASVDAGEMELDDRSVINLQHPQDGVILTTNGIARGSNSKAMGHTAFAAGLYAVAAGKCATAFGMETEAGYCAFATGKQTIARGLHSFTQGYLTKASGSCSAAFGRNNEAYSYATFVAGQNNTATGDESSVFGRDNYVNSVRTFVAGCDNSVEDAGYSFAVGTRNNIGASSAEGNMIGGFDCDITSGKASIALGNKCKADGWYSCAIQNDNRASGGSFVVGAHNQGSVMGQLVCGQYSLVTSADYLVVGIGTGEGQRKNGFSVSKNGSIMTKGNATIHGEINCSKGSHSTLGKGAAQGSKLLYPGLYDFRLFLTNSYIQQNSIDYSSSASIIMHIPDDCYDTAGFRTIVSPSVHLYYYSNEGGSETNVELRVVVRVDDEDLGEECWTYSIERKSGTSWLSTGVGGYTLRVYRLFKTNSSTLQQIYGE